MAESDLSAAFGMPPSRAVEYFRSKGYRITFDYRALAGEAHAKAFTIAKATDEVLQIVRGELDRAFAAGVTEREFIQRLAPRLVQAGWWGRQSVIGPDGTEQSVLLGSHRRLRTIYRTNLQTAYMAGRYLEFKENARARPYWMYVAIMDHRVRPSHAALNGLVMRHDDPFWDDFFPPNGWGCFLPDTKVRGDFQIGLRSHYTGPAVEVQTAAGHRLRVTANHPVLTTRGWLPAHQISEGDTVLSHRGNINSVVRGVVDDQEPPRLAPDVFQSLAGDGFRVAPVAADDFHGDAALRKGEVDVAGSQAHLVLDLAPKRAHRDQEFLLEFSARAGILESFLAERSSLSEPVPGERVPLEDAPDVRDARSEQFRDLALRHQRAAIQRYDLALEHVVASAGGRPGGTALAFQQSTIGLDVGPLQSLRFAAAAHAHAVQPQETFDGASAAAILVGQLLDANAGAVTLDRVERVRKFDWSGHVYDFQTQTGLILSEGIITHNCRCRVRALSEENVRSRGLDVVDGARYVRRQRVTDIHSGLVSEVATFRPPWRARAVAPDPGWSYNPGKAWSLWDQAGRLPDAIAGATAAAGARALRAVPGQRTWRDYDRPDAQRVPQAERRAAPALLPAQPTREAAVDAVAIALGMPSDGSSIEVATPIETVVITRRLLPHIVDKRDNAREQFAGFVLPTLRDPWEIWLTEFEDGRVRPRYIGLYTGSRDTLVVVRRNADGSLVWNYLNVNDRRLNAWREGWLAYQRPARAR